MEERKGEQIRDLDKLTTTKLRELALERYPQIEGVHGMKKEELVEAIKVVEIELGIREEDEEGKASHAKVRPKGKRREKKVVDMPQAKVMVRGLKGERDGAVASGDHKRLKVVRTKIRRLKRIMRKLREAS